MRLQRVKLKEEYIVEGVKMIKKQLAKNVFQFVFKPLKERNVFSDTIITIINNKRALLIDTGFPQEARQLKEYLKQEGITVEKIIISHWHPDHFLGLSEFPEAEVYGSGNHVETHVSEGMTAEKIEKFSKFTPINERTTLNFGDHQLELIPHVGHSVCTLLIKINEEFIFVADDIILSLNDELMVPYLCGKGGKKEIIEKQLQGFETLQNYSSFKIIPAHGSMFDGSKLASYINNLTIYLNNIQNAEPPFEEAVVGCELKLVGESFHRHNIKLR